MKTIYYTLTSGDVFQRDMEDKEAEKHLDNISMKQGRSVRWTEKCNEEDGLDTETIEYVIPMDHIVIARSMDTLVYGEVKWD